MTEPPATAPVRGLLVLGMYRSGTSALTRALNLLGANLGATLMPASDANRSGFWEHSAVVDINERMFASLGRSTFDPREMPRDWTSHPHVADACASIADLYRNEFAESPLWAIKDPRLCRLLPVWRTVIEREGCALGALLIVRDPARVIDSMDRLGWIASASRARLSWLQYLLEAERFSRGMPRVVIEYDAMLRDWRTTLARAGQALGVDWSNALAERGDEIEGFLEPVEAHARPECEAACIPDWIGEALRICRMGADIDWSQLAGLGDRYRLAAEVFAPVLDEALVEASITRLESDQARASSNGVTQPFP